MKGAKETDSFYAGENICQNHKCCGPLHEHDRTNRQCFIDKIVIITIIANNISLVWSSKQTNQHNIPLKQRKWE